MFTGLIEAVGSIRALEDRGRDRRLWIDWPDSGEPGSGETGSGETGTDRVVETGDSVAVAGVCLTAVEPDAAGFAADVSAETLAHTNLGACDVGSRVNLERALLPTTRLGGHLVSGHVDALGRIRARERDGESWRFRFALPAELMRYCAPRGSICVDGISLTVTDVDDDGFGVNIVPHTLAMTTLADAAIGTHVNIEIDLIARYLERLLHNAAAPDRE